MCLFPKLVNNPKYRANKKNGGVIPAVSDKRVLLVPIGCGKCMECKKKKKREWMVRLEIEKEHDKNNLMNFVTLTFNDKSIKELSIGKNLEGYDLDNYIAKKGVRRFLERWRKEHKKSIKHWLVTELGHDGTENIHLHGILWNKNNEEIEKHWQYGFVHFGKYVNRKTINYITKYISKTDEQHKYYNPKILSSAGIGKQYIEYGKKYNQYNKNTREFYKNEKGFKLGLPIYFRNHIYTEEEREKLWLEKLDKGITYINGIKVKVADEKQYYATLYSQRELNKMLGYGDDSINWDEKRHERNLRNLNIRKRIERAEAKEKILIEPTKTEDSEIKPNWDVSNAFGEPRK